jgi:hypothetical protein
MRNFIASGSGHRCFELLKLRLALSSSEILDAFEVEFNFSHHRNPIAGHAPISDSSSEFLNVGGTAYSNIHLTTSVIAQ